MIYHHLKLELTSYLVCESTSESTREKKLVLTEVRGHRCEKVWTSYVVCRLPFFSTNCCCFLWRTKVIWSTHVSTILVDHMTATIVKTWWTFLQCYSIIKFPNIIQRCKTMKACTSKIKVKCGWELKSRYTADYGPFW